MFITTPTENSKGCLNSIVIGHAHELEEALLLVLVGHPHCSPSLLRSNLNPNGFLLPHAKSTNSTILASACHVYGKSKCNTINILCMLLAISKSRKVILDLQMN